MYYMQLKTGNASWNCEECKQSEQGSTVSFAYKEPYMEDNADKR